MDDRDRVLERAIDELRALPKVRPDATAQVLVAVAAERQRRREAEVALVGGRRHLRWTIPAIAAAVLVIGLSLRARTPQAAVGHDSRAPMTENGLQALPVTRTSHLANAPRSVQLVLSAPGAHSVHVVGDFNGWDDRQSPMVRDEASGLWNANVMLRPGRHVYAFVVNDTQWVRDPRAPAAPDADFGRPGSVLLVERP